MSQETWNQGMKSTTAEDRKAAESSVVPAGLYNVQVEEAGFKRSNNGKGYFGLTLNILGPTSAGRKVFDKYWIESSNKDYVKQCFAKIQSMAVKGGADPQTVDQMQPSDFVGIRVAAKIKITKDDQYGDSNEVVSYKAIKDDFAVGNTAAPAQENFAADDIPF